jgi:putative membrane protein
MKSFAIATLTLALVTAAAHAQMPQNTGGSAPPGSTAMANPSGVPDGKLSQADHSFITKAAGAGLAEVSEAKIAVKNASSPDVRQFAQQMIADHSNVNRQLKRIAIAEGIKIPSRPGPADRAAAGRLSRLSGADFDIAYVADQVNAHQDAVELFSQERQMGSDARLKAFATQTLPTLQNHLAMVNQLAGNAANQRPSASSMAPPATGGQPQQKARLRPGGTDPMG